MGKKPKIVEIDIIRAIAILAVVVIHGTSNAVMLPLGTVSQAVFFTVNRLSHFTVPVFIWVSGLVLFYSYYDAWDKRSAFAFMVKRLRLILVPYVLWSIFYYVFNQWMFHSVVHLDPWYLIKLLISGNASYHLYYIIIILQFYLVFPVLISLCKRSAKFRLLLIPIGIGVEAAFYSFSHWVRPIPYFESLFPGYCALFAFGAFTGIYHAEVLRWVNHWSVWVYVTCLLSGTAFTGMYVGSQYGIVSFENTWYELVLLLYCGATALSVLLFGQKLLGQNPWYAGALLSLGSASFGIYLAHPALLTLWDHVVKPPTDVWQFDLHTIAAILLSLLGAWGLTVGYRWIRWQKKAVAPSSKNLPS
jgi:peptidoglycan/LPS O-acetylase OafA/YrhL